MGTQQVVIILLRLIHIVAGVFWVGSTVLITRFLLPSVAALGPASANFMREIAFRRRLPIALNGAGVATVLAGVGLYASAQFGSNGAWARTPMGVSIGIGAALAIVAVVVGTVRARPAAQRMGVIGEQIVAAGGSPPADLVAEMQMQRDRFAGAMRINTGLLVLATASMAIARYV
jgi:hypothetical protein